MSKRVYYSEEEFEAAFYAPRRRCPFRPKRRDDPFDAAAHFIGGALLRDGFRLFNNGGTPLLERHDGPLVEEIVLQQRQGHASEPVVLAVRVHLSHQKLRDIRARYWTTPARAPVHLASGNVGELEIPPGWAVWDVTEGGLILARLVEWIRELAIPWFDLFEDPVRLIKELHEHDVPLLNHVAALEWILAEFGKREARDYYGSLLLSDALESTSEARERILSLNACFHLSRR